MARPKTKTTAQVKNDYAKKAYDDVRLQVKKGKKEIIKSHATAHGESVNGFINRAIDHEMERDNAVEKQPEEPQAKEIPRYQNTGGTWEQRENISMPELLARALDALTK